MDVCSWAGGCQGHVPVAGWGVAGDAESLGGPGECEGGSVELGFRDRFLFEISFAGVPGQPRTDLLAGARVPEPHRLCPNCPSLVAIGIPMLAVAWISSARGTLKRLVTSRG